jgi:hypothetical protein
MGSHVLVCAQEIHAFVARRERDYPGVRESFGQALRALESRTFGLSKNDKTDDMKYSPTGMIGVYEVLLKFEILSTGYVSVLAVGFPGISKPQKFER